MIFIIYRNNKNLFMVYSCVINYNSSSSKVVI